MIFKANLFSNLLSGTLIITIFYLVFLGPSETYIWLTEEDGPVEWIGALSFLFASILFIACFHRSKVERFPFSRRFSWTFLILALAFLVAFAEEISYGQRIFGLETPDMFMENNMQGEINLHNLSWFHPDGEDDSSKEGLMKYFSAKWLFNYFCTFYFVLIPGFYHSSRLFRRLNNDMRIPIPPLWPGILAMINIGISKLIMLFFESKENIDDELFFETQHSIAEFMESIWAILILLTAYILYKNPRAGE